MPRWWHKLLIDLACNPDATAEDLSVATGYTLSTVGVYLNSMIRAAIVDFVRHEDEDGRLPNTYSLTDTGERMFEQIIEADAALKRLAGQRRVKR
jgi:DNA-binding MarR family transcriptional regulator